MIGQVPLSISLQEMHRPPGGQGRPRRGPRIAHRSLLGNLARGEAAPLSAAPRPRPPPLPLLLGRKRALIDRSHRTTRRRLHERLPPLYMNGGRDETCFRRSRRARSRCCPTSPPRARRCRSRCSPRAAGTGAASAPARPPQLRARPLLLTLPMSLLYTPSLPQSAPPQLRAPPLNLERAPWQARPL